MQKFYITFLSLLFIYNAHSADHEWHGAGSACGDTVLACFESANDGDTIYIRSNATINENLNLYTYNKGVSLIAVEGYKPTFNHFSGINMQVHFDTVIQGLTLNSGGINIAQSDSAQANSSIKIIANTVSTTGAGSSIYVSNEDDLNTLNVEIKYNQVDHNLNGNVAVGIGSFGDGTYNINGLIYGNTVTVHNENSRGIGVSASDLGSYNVDIIGNTVYGATNTAIYAQNYINPSELTVTIASNAMYSIKGGAKSGGVYLLSQVGSPGFTHANIYNNTVLSGATGIRVDGRNLESRIEFALVNNLITKNEVGFDLINPANVIVTQNDTNIFYNNDSYVNFPFDSGTNLVLPFGTVLTKGLIKGRLFSDSAAIDAGTSVSFSPFVDADGLHRETTGGLDIGAYEFGNVTLSIEGKGESYSQQISHQQVNSQPSMSRLHISQNATFHEFPIPESEGASMIPNPYNNNANVGLWYNMLAGRWNVFNQDTITVLTSGAGFNLFKFSASDNAFEHAVSASLFAFSTMNREGLNSGQDKILQISQHWIGEYNDHPTGIYYNDFTNRWSLYNLDLEPLLTDSNFNVYYQDASKSAWEHIATDENTSGRYTILDHQLINGVECAQIQITQNATHGVFNDHPVGVRFNYEENVWQIQMQPNPPSGPPSSVPDMPVGAAFHILVSPEQIESCEDTIFLSHMD